MPRECKVFLKDVLECIQKIEDHVGKIDFELFEEDEWTQDAVIRNFEVIGEATKSIPDEIKKKFPEIDWKKVVGLRDVLIHQYSSVNVRILWDIIQNKMPELKRVVLNLLNQTK